MQDYDKAVDTLYDCLKTRKDYHGTENNLEIADTESNLANAILFQGD